MKTKLSLTGMLLILFNYLAISQVVTTIPAFPSDGDEVTVIFDATQGNAGLAGFTGDVYAHTGVITNLSSSPTDWKYVIAGWSDNIPAAKLERISDDLYHLQITPSIREFYGVPATETILQMAFVFRSADGTVTGRDVDGSDIYADVYETGLNVKITAPLNESIFNIDENISITAEATLADSLFLYVDNQLVSSVANNNVSYAFSSQTEGIHWIRAIATDANSDINDSVFFYIKGDVVVEDVPDGMKDGVNYIDNNTVTLVLYAPDKEFVYALGDYSDWLLYTQNPDKSYMMKQSTDGKRYWITIDGLEAGKEYIYQYYIDGELKIADPYTDKTSDPNMDKYISNSIYPNLIEYPTGKTSEIASVFQTNQTPYAWEVADFQPPAVTDLIVYELLVRDFTENRDIKTITDTLDYLENLGVNAIELMPFNEFEGNDSWGYNPSFYFAPDKAYGPKNEYKKFIDECHKRGIAVFMDLVLNHTYGQSPLVRMYWNAELNRPAANNPWYNETSNFQNPDAQWGYDLNHDSPDTRKLVDSINSYWMSEYHIDGFRFDFTKGFSNTPYGPNSWGSEYDAERISNLERMASEIWKRKENAFVIFEHLSDNPEEKELAEYGILLWGNSNYNYNEATMGWNENGKSDFSWISYKKRSWSSPHVVGYMESHDEERLMYKNIQYGNSAGSYNVKDLSTALKRIELAATFFITVPGPKMLWQFGELGYDISIDYDCRVCPKPVKWDYYDDGRRKRLYQVYRALINLKLNNVAFSSSDFSMNTNSSVKSIKINHSSMNVNILGNFDVVSKDIDPAFQQTGYWYEFFTGDSINVANTNQVISFEPGEYRIYTTVKLATPDIVSATVDLNRESGQILVYPNPSNQQFNIELKDFSGNIQNLQIVNILGETVELVNKEQLIKNNYHYQWNSINEKNGLYFCVIRTNSSTYTQKLLKY
ncbi:MAG: T9SS type A sorting domain-containing protein [Chlorobi bacterium]|nr:T9SS type A sorting domain-containing protein [Chlorobiota bacterium]